MEWAAKGGSALCPYDQYGEEEVEEIPFEQPCRTVLNVYNSDPTLRRLFHVIVGKVSKGTGRNREGIVDELKVRAGHCETFFIGDHTVKMPKSISEKKGCDELTFRAFFDAAMVALTDDPFNIDQSEIEAWMAEAKQKRASRR